MFSLLDSKTDVKIVTDLILSFLPLRFIDYTSDDVLRIYRRLSEAGGPEPCLCFRETVWADRLCNPDSSNGLRLRALNFLEETKETDIMGRPFPTQSTILCDILTSIQHPSHSLCNSAIRKLISEQQDVVSGQEYDYLNDHFCSQLLNNFYGYLDQADPSQITHSGIGYFLAHILDLVGKNDRCSEIRECILEWIMSKFAEDDDTFTKFVFSPHLSKFKNIHNRINPNSHSLDPELVESFRLCLVDGEK